MATELRHRAPAPTAAEIPGPEILAGAQLAQPVAATHPSGKEKHGWLVQVLRGLSALFFLVSCSTACVTSKPCPDSSCVIANYCGALLVSTLPSLSAHRSTGSAKTSMMAIWP